VEQRLTATPAIRRRVMFGTLVAATVALAATVPGAPAAAAAAGWSRVPASGLGGGTVALASSSTTPCRWTEPAATPDPTAPTAPSAADAVAPLVVPAADAVTYDGTEVRVRLSRAGVDVPLGRLPVGPGGAWSGTVTIPEAAVLGPGAYDLIVQCVVDQLDGVRTFDFDPLPFTVIEGPPPTTVEVPTELIPPLTVTNPVQVEGEQITRPAAAPTSVTTAASPTLPNTGDGTLGVMLAGLGALVVGGGALWWCARHSRRHAPADLLD
jgi:LPXTG-motif cell wall-anchored protein